MVNEFLAYAKEKGVEASSQEVRPVITELKRLLKARLAKHLFGDEGFYSTWNDGDPMVRKALEVLQLSDPVTVTKEQQEKK